MSIPTSSFSKLAISGMPPTSISTSQHNRGTDDPVSSSEESSGSEEDSGEDSDTSTSRILTSKNTSLHYDTSLLSPRAAFRARAGLKSSFAFTDYSRMNEESPSREYFGIQISETSNFIVRVGAPGSEFANLTCTCADETPCRHTFFLLDQVANHTLSSKEKQDALLLTKEGLPKETLDAFQRIKDAEPGLLKKLISKRASNSSGIERKTSQERIVVETERIDDVRDVLASFSGTETKDNYRPDIFDNLKAGPIAQNQLFSKDLEKTLTLSMITNEQVFDHFRIIVSASHCACDYFKKKLHEAKNALQAMDTYTTNRPARTPSPLPDVAWCANIVETAVSDIVARVNEAREPLSQTAREGAAEALSLILRDLSRRNVDVYNRTTWAHTRQATFDVRDRNIFARFFRYLPKDGRKFILDDLSDLGDALRGFLELLQEVAESFEAAFKDDQAPKAYADKLQRLIRDLKPRGRGKSGSKRPGDESGGDNKRMK